MTNTAIGGALAAPVAAAAGAGNRNVRAQQERLAGLLQEMESVAERLRADEVSTTERTVLVAQFNDLERQVNELDGLVAAEGMEASARGEVNGAAIQQERQVTTAPARGTEAPAAPGAPPAQGATGTARAPAPTTADRPATGGQVDVTV